MRVEDVTQEKSQNVQEFFIDIKIATAVREKVRKVFDLFYYGLEQKTMESILQNQKDEIINSLINKVLFRVLSIIDPRLFDPVSIRSIKKAIEEYNSSKETKISARKNNSYSFVTGLMNSPNYISIEDSVLDVLINSELNFTLEMLSILKTNREEILKIFKIEFTSSPPTLNLISKSEKELFVEELKKAIQNILTNRSKVTQKNIYQEMGIKRQTFESRLSKYRIKRDAISKLFVDLTTGNSI